MQIMNIYKRLMQMALTRVNTKKCQRNQTPILKKIPDAVKRQLHTNGCDDQAAEFGDHAHGSLRNLHKINGQRMLKLEMIILKSA